MGVILTCFYMNSKKLSTTHTRGGDPKYSCLAAKYISYYPHTWGWSSLAFKKAIQFCVLPTHVGVILSYTFSDNDLICTTHTRGGDPAILKGPRMHIMYYPHTWGWSWLWRRAWDSYLVLPTHVGVILLMLSLPFTCFSTTHTRGGDPKKRTKAI